MSSWFRLHCWTHKMGTCSTDSNGTHMYRCARTLKHYPWLLSLLKLATWSVFCLPSFWESHIKGSTVHLPVLVPVGQNYFEAVLKPECIQGSTAEVWKRRSESSPAPSPASSSASSSGVKVTSSPPDLPPFLVVFPFGPLLTPLFLSLCQRTSRVEQDELL